MIQARRTTILVLFAMVTIIAVAVAVGTIMAQTRPTLSDALEPKKGDATVVATVQGLQVTRGDVRRAGEFWMMTDGSMTKDTAEEKSIVAVIGEFIIKAEINRRELTPTSEEVEEYIRPYRDVCLGENGAECRAAVESLGFDPNSDEYWENIALPEYGKALGEIKLFRAVIIERDMGGASEEDLVALRNALPGELRKKATIVWHDEDLEQAYQQALAEE